MELYLIIYSSIFVLVEISLLCAVGVVLAKTGILSKDRQRFLSDMTLKVFLPFSFVNSVASTVSIDNIVSLWPVPVFAVLNIVIGCGLGFCLRPFTRITQGFKRIYVVLCGVCNDSTIPLKMVMSLCAANGPLGKQPHSLEKGVTYVALFTAATVFCIWVICYPYILKGVEEEEKKKKQKKKKGQGDEGGAGSIKQTKPRMSMKKNHNNNINNSINSMNNPNNQDSIVDIAPSIYILDDRETNERQTLIQRPPSQQDDNNTINHVSYDDYGSLSDIQLLLKNENENKIFGFIPPYKSWPITIKALTTPIVVAILLSVAVGLCTPLKRLIFGDPSSHTTDPTHPPLAIIAKVCNDIGGGGVAASVLCLLLGSSLYHTASFRFTTHWRAILSISIVKLVLLPVIGIIMITAIRHWGWISVKDDVLFFVLCVEFAVPSNIAVALISSQHHLGEEETATVMFFSYVFSLFTQSGFMIAILHWAQHPFVFS